MCVNKNVDFYIDSPPFGGGGAGGGRWHAHKKKTKVKNHRAFVLNTNFLFIFSVHVCLSWFARNWVRRRFWIFCKRACHFEMIFLLLLFILFRNIFEINLTKFFRFLICTSKYIGSFFLYVKYARIFQSLLTKNVLHW